MFGKNDELRGKGGGFLTFLVETFLPVEAFMRRSSSFASDLDGFSRRNRSKTGIQRAKRRLLACFSLFFLFLIFACKCEAKEWGKKRVCVRAGKVLLFPLGQRNF